MLQQHDIRRVFAQWPGPLLANDIDIAERRTDTNTMPELATVGGRLGMRAIVDQVATEMPLELFIDQQPLLFEQQLPQGPRQPLPGRAHQLQPARIDLGGEFIVHRLVL